MSAEHSSYSHAHRLLHNSPTELTPEDHPTVHFANMMQGLDHLKNLTTLTSDERKRVTGSVERSAGVILGADMTERINIMQQMTSMSENKPQRVRSAEVVFARVSQSVRPFKRA